MNDLRAEQKKIVVRGGLGALTAAAILAGGVILLPRALTVPEDRWDRFAIVLVCNLLVGLWVAFGVRWVSRIRFLSEADNSGSAYSQPSDRIAVPRAFLQNTLEQAFLSVIGSLALVIVDGPQPVSYVIATVLCFSVGRLTFLIGYPSGAGGRAFGMVATTIPFIGAVGWVAVHGFSQMM